MRVPALLMLALLTSTLASAHERMSLPNGGRVTYERLFEVRAEPGETLDTFAKRVSPRLREFSDATGFEACGTFAQAGDGVFGVVIGTNHSHIACAVRRGVVPEGMTAVDEHIHSHGIEEARRMTDSDRTFAGIRSDARSRHSAVIYGQTIDAFSEQDLHGSRGYLATPVGTLHHDGAGTVRVVQ